MDFFVNRRKAFKVTGPVDAANLDAQYLADGVIYNIGTTQVTNGQTVATWVDATGKGNDITQATANRKPIWEADTGGGYPGVHFDGSLHRLLLGSALKTAPPFSWYAVVEHDTATSDGYAFTFVNNAAASDYYGLLVNGTAGGDPIAHIARRSGTGQALTTTGITAATTHLISGQEASTTSRHARIDGGSQGSNTTSVSPIGINEFSVGALERSSPAGFLDGIIREIRIYGVAHGTTTEAAVEAQMSAYWGF